MKFYLSCILFACTSFLVSAQFSKGSLFVGTTLGGNYDQTSSTDPHDYSTISTRTFTMSGSSQVGVFVANDLIIGGSLYSNLAREKETSTAGVYPSVALPSNDPLVDTKKTRIYTFTVGPFLRYYINSKSKNKLYVETNVAAGSGRGSGSETDNFGTYTSIKMSKIFNWNGSAAMGITHCFTDGLGMDVAFGYFYNATRSTVNTDNDGYTQVLKQKSHTSTLGINLGFHWFFSKNSKRAL